MIINLHVQTKMMHGHQFKSIHKIFVANYHFTTRAYSLFHFHVIKKNRGFKHTTIYSLELVNENPVISRDRERVGGISSKVFVSKISLPNYGKALPLKIVR